MKTVNPDFEAVKAALQFESVLSHYDLQTKGRAPQVSVVCPFHDDHKESCGVNLERNIFNCFACKASGNALEFVCLMEDLDPEDHKDDLKKGALIALEIMSLDPADFEYRKGKAPAKTKTKKQKAKVKKLTPETDTQEPVENAVPAVNEPLKFELQLQDTHEFFEERNITAEQVKEFGLGYCGKGIMAGRICIPLHDEKGQLVAYAGRYAKAELPEKTLRYKLPKGFHKNLVLFNLHRLLEQQPKHVVLVEGYWSAIRLHEEEIPTVASLGASLSDQQVALLVNAGVRHVTVIYDGDEGGRTGAKDAVERLSAHLYVRKLELPDGIKPDVMNEEYLNRLR